MDAALSDLIERTGAAGRITPDDVLALRQTVYHEIGVTAEEAEALIEIDAAAERCPEWNALFIEALTDYIVRQQEPVGYVGEMLADWLMTRLAKDGKIRVESELKLLIHILQEADSCPHALVAFTLDKLKDAVLAYGKVTRGGVDMLRAVLYAAGGDGNITVARPEAEVLFDINDACRQAANAPEWSDFFAKAVGAAVMLAPTYEPESKEDALKDEAWLKSKGGGIGDFIGRMFRPGPKSPDLAQQIIDKRDAGDALLAAAEPVTAEEAHWLVSRLGKGGALDPAEQALVAFLRKESPSLDPALQPLLDKASRAA